VDEELEKWKREVEAAEEEVKRKKKGYVEKEEAPEAPVTGGDPERPSTPPEGEREFTDDDGTVYAWDDKRRAWVPKEGLKEYNPEEMVFVPEEEVIPSLPPPADLEKEGDSPDEEAPQKVWSCLKFHVIQLMSISLAMESFFFVPRIV
jgi:HIV Tat-specific factor 1